MSSLCDFSWHGLVCGIIADQQGGCCRQMSSAVAEAEKLKAAGDAHKRDLVQAKLVEREAELASMRDKLRAANREVSSESLPTPLLLQVGVQAASNCLLGIAETAPQFLMGPCRYDEGAW